MLGVGGWGLILGLSCQDNILVNNISNHLQKPKAKSQKPKKKKKKKKKKPKTLIGNQLVVA